MTDLTTNYLHTKYQWSTAALKPTNTAAVHHYVQRGKWKEANQRTQPHKNEKQPI